MSELVFLVKAENYDTANKLLQDLSKFNCKYQLIDDVGEGYLFEEKMVSKVSDITEKRKHFNKAELKQHNRIGNILSSYGLSSTNLGYSYAIDAIKLINAYGINNYSMMSDIYPGVADIYNVTPMSVEHNIRNSIYKAWNAFQDGYNDNTGIAQFRKRPTNKKFLEHIAKKSNYVIADYS